MALNKAQLTADLVAAFSAGQGGTKTQAEVAAAIADAVDAFVKGGTVTTVVTGTDSLGGAVVGTGTGAVG